MTHDLNGLNERLFNLMDDLRKVADDPDKEKKKSLIEIAEKSQKIAETIISAAETDLKGSLIASQIKNNSNVKLPKLLTSSQTHEDVIDV